jgi:ADP-heptose:LPS heptosyltransferase
VLALCDLVIAVDTAVVHLAGAMGRPVWVLVPFAPDWRWSLQGETTPWYPTARLFRQTSLGDWDGVIARVRDELRRFVPSLA